MVRIFSPCSSRWVANECLSVCMVTRLSMCAAFAASCTARLSCRVLMESNGSRPGNKYPPGSTLPAARAWRHQVRSQWVVGIIAATALGGLFMTVYTKGKDIFPEHALPVVENDNTQKIATMLYGQYMFAFEIASLLLLVAIIGAVVMAKKRI